MGPSLICRPPPAPPPEQSRRGWDPDYTAPGAYMILMRRSLDRFKGGSDARLSFLKARPGNFLPAPGRFDLKEDPANSQGVLNNFAKLTLKRRPLLNRVQH